MEMEEIFRILLIAALFAAAVIFEARPCAARFPRLGRDRRARAADEGVVLPPRRRPGWW